MLLNYFKIAWRNLLRNKVFSAVNILGLALGMTASLLITLWIQDERSIGTGYANSPYLYRVMEHEIADGRIVTDEDTPGILADELKRQFPEVVYAAGFSSPESHLLTAQTKSTKQPGHFVGSDWLAMYSLPLLAGNSNALQASGSIAVSRKLAELYFGSPQKAIGRSVRVDNASDYQITAVFENVPAHSPDTYEFLVNWSDYLRREPWLTDWSNAGPGTRLQLRQDADPALVAAKLKTFLKGRNADIGPSFNIELFLQPELEAYLYSNFKDGQRTGGRIAYVRLFAVVSVFLLLIASINFMNLSTARSIRRGREVGIRKVIGAHRAALVGQFLGEAMLLTGIALLLALVLVTVLLPLFNQLTGKQLVLPLQQPAFAGFIFGLLLVMGLLAGSYPAFFLSALQPAQVLKGALRLGSGVLSFRRGLVVFQFVLSMLLIVGTLIVFQQLEYIQTKQLGYDRGNLIQIRGEGLLAQKYATFKQDLLRIPAIASVSHMQTNPLYNGNTTDGINWTGKDPAVAIQFNNTWVGYDFTQTMKIRLVAGRDFSPHFGTDSVNYLINQSAAQRIGYKDPIGQPLSFGKTPGKIVGVVEDFHFNSLHVPIRPLVIRLAENWNWDQILIRVQPGQTQAALAGIESVCRKLNPDFPFTYSFVDAEYEKLYQSETRVGTLATLFASLAIFIACLGLFGLAAFTAEQRTKEIGIRKVLGASVHSIVGLLSKDFLRLVALAIVIASPLAWFAMNRWLQGFAYRIAIGWEVFALAGLLAIVIALVTVSFQALRAALANPVKSLKTE